MSQKVSKILLQKHFETMPQRMFAVMKAKGGPAKYQRVGRFCFFFLVVNLSWPSSILDFKKIYINVDF